MMVTIRAGWRCWVNPTLSKRGTVTLEHICDTGEADVEEFSLTMTEAEELRDLLTEMLDPYREKSELCRLIG